MRCIATIALIGLVAAVAHATVASSFPGQNDRVAELPLFNGTLPSAHYSGYLNGLNGSQLHYYFVEASGADPAKAPVVVWMNGGPGCSSMDGWGYELGPFHFRNYGGEGPTFVLNEFTWTKRANVIFLEAPPGVGFSYRNDMNYTITDTMNAKDNHAALVDFFVKFPQFAKNKFYVSGESYGGVYVPTLVDVIITENKIRLDGMLVGNGCTSADCDNYVEGDLRFAFYHNLISEEFYNAGRSACLGNMNSQACQQNQYEYNTKFMKDVNPYGVYYKCFVAPTANWKFVPSLRRRLNALAKEAGMTVDQYLANVPTSPPGGQVPCIDSTAMTTYLNREDVKAALHVLPSLSWEICSNIPYHGNVFDVAYVYRKLRARGTPILVYNGNIDTSVPYTTVQYWLDNDLKFNVTQKFHPWTYSDAAFPYGQQLGGYAIKYDNLMDFVTVNGAGHMVPQFQPAAALAMFERFLFGQGF